MEQEYKYASFDIYDKGVKIMENLSYTEAVEYILKNKHNLFAKFIYRVNSAEGWDCDFFLRHETDLKY